MEIIRANERFVNEHSWLKSYFLFSFDRYYDPSNESFQALRVFNDDRIKAHSGFPPHPHRDMEIVTIVLKGAITHKDSSGGEGKIRAGEVQRMSAGTGIVHSEMNEEDEETHLYQLWLIPRKLVSPGYEQKKFSEELSVVASGQGKGGLYIETDATIHRGKLSKELKLENPFFLYVTSGEASIDSQKLTAGDQARSEKGALISGSAEIVLVEF